MSNELEKLDKRFHEGFFKKTMNGLLVLLLKGISHLPFWVIYRISDFIYFLLRWVVKYRWKVILDNLAHAFPEKSEKERKLIAQKYYRHFADFSLETVKLYSISREEIQRRVKMVGTEKMDAYGARGEGVIFLGAHYNNWEWCSSVQTHWKYLRLLMITNPIRGNRAFENFVTHSREQWGGMGVHVHKSARMALEFARRKEPTALWLGADQTAPANSHFWTYFLNREAPFFSGPEKIAAKTKQPVFFMHVKKLRRGYYEAHFELLFEKPGEMDPKDIMLGYIRRMEKMIREEPEYYLWSHRRWKHTRPADIPLTL